MNSTKKPSKEESSMDEVLGELQPWSWTFFRLWEFCGAVQPKYVQNIPDTILFEDGKPSKWLYTENDVVCRRDFEIKWQPGKTSNITLAKMNLIYKCFQNLRLDDNDPLCLAVYQNRSVEKIYDIKVLRKLGKKQKWRKSLQGLQRYIVPEVHSVGIYESNRKKAKNTAGSNPALDMMAKKLALHLEKACKAHPLRAPHKVYHLEINFVIRGSEDKLYMTHANVRAQLLELKFATQAEIDEGTDVVADQIHDIIDRASGRGLTYKGLFSHFDPTGTGSPVTPDQFVVALSRVGVRVPPKFKDNLLRRLGKNLNGMVSHREFKKFCIANAERVRRVTALLQETKREEARKRQREREANTKREGNVLKIDAQTAGKTYLSSSSIREMARQESAESGNGVTFASTLQTLPMSTYKGSTLGLTNGVDMPVTEALGDWVRESNKQTYQDLQKGKPRGRKKKKKNVRKRSRSKSRERRKAGDENPAEDPPLVLPSYQYFVNVTPDTTMTYRVVTQQQAAEFHAAAELERRKAINPLAADVQAQEMSNEVRGLYQHRDRAFRCLVLPGLFQSLDSLEALMAPIIAQYTRAVFVLVGFPGQPHTQWPKPEPGARPTVTLNNQMLSEAVCSLLTHLETVNAKKQSNQARWKAMAGGPCLIMATGNGANVATYLATHLDILSCPPSFTDHLRAMMLVNAFGKISRDLRKALNRLLKMHDVASHQERMENLSALLFSQDYLNRTSKRIAFERFYAHMRSWVMTGAELDAGVSALVQGALQHVNVLKSARNCGIPVLLVTGSSNGFVPAQNTSDLVTALEEGGVGGGTASSIAECLASGVGNTPFVVWLKGGHLIAQERLSFFRKTVHDFIKHGLPPLPLPSEPPPEDDGIPDDERGLSEAAVLRLRRKKRRLAAKAARGEAGEDDPDKTITPRYGNRLVDESSDSDEDDLVGRKERDPREVDIEWKMRDAEAERMERQMALEEARLMAVEDEHMRFVMKAEKNAARYAGDSERGKWQVEHLQQLREDTFQKRKAEKIQRAQAEKREEARIRKERRKRALKTKRFALHDMDLEGQELGYGLEAGDDQPEVTLAGSRRLRKDMGLIRKRKAMGLRQQLPIVEQQMRMRESEHSLDKMLDDVVRARILTVREKKKLKHKIKQAKKKRAAVDRVIAEKGGYGAIPARERKKIMLMNDAMKVDEMALEARKVELESLKVKEKELEPKLAKVRSHLRQINNESEYITSVVQQIIIVQRNLMDSMEQMLNKLQADYDALHKKKSDIMEAKEDASERMYQLTLIVDSRRKRLDNLKAEQERCELWQKEYIDSDVYQEGVMQRLKVSVLLPFCKQECDKADKVLKKKMEDLERAVEFDRTAGERRDTFADTLIAFQEEAQNLRMAYMRCKQVSATEELLQQEEEKRREKRALAHKQMIGNYNEMNAILGIKTLGAKARIKNADERSTEERNFIALDVLLHPELYQNLRAEDRETMEVDAAYHPKVTQAAVRRIATLPAQLNVSLPHLYSREEIEAHVMLHHYEFGNGLEDLKFKDKQLDLGRAERKAARQLRAAEIRAKMPDERDQEENEWASVDAQLHPSLWPYDEGLPCIVDSTFDKNEITRIMIQTLGKLQLAEERRVWRLCQKYCLPGDVSNDEPPMDTHAGICVNKLTDVTNSLKLGPTFLRTNVRHTLLTVRKATLAMRERHCHKFEVPDFDKDAAGNVDESSADDIKCMNLRVNIIFKGQFDARGYSLGRLSAALYYRPRRHDMEEDAQPNDIHAIPIGYCSDKDVMHCTAASFGRICITHRPKKLPVHPGHYEVSIVGLSKTQYNLSVSAELIKTPGFTVQEIVAASTHHVRIHQLQKRIREVRLTIRLGQRKLKLAVKLLRQADKKYDKLRSERQDRVDQLEDPETRYLMTTAAIAETRKEILQLDRQLVKMGHVVSLRRDEVKCIREPLTELAANKRVFVARLNRLETEQTTIRENIPPVVSAIVGVPLPPLVGEPQDWTTLNRLPVPKWAKHALKTTMPYLVTPAEIVRRKRSEQWTVDEREWRKLDLILNPHKNQDLNPEASLALANLPKYSQYDLELLQVRPLRDLNRAERRHRALLRTYHDNLPETQVQTVVKSMRMIGRFWKKLLKARKEEAAMKRVRDKEAQQAVTTDVDARARELLTDLDRAVRCHSKMIDSRILHMTYQRFPVAELQEALEINLNRLLIMQIREREKGTQPKVEEEEEVDEEELGPDVARLSHFVGIGRLTLAERRRRKAHNELVKLTNGDKDKEPTAAAEMNKQSKNKKPKLILDDSNQMKPVLEKKVEYKPFLDWAAAKKRRNELDEEMELVRSSTSDYMISTVPGSVRNGGTARFYRKDLLAELYRENQRVRLEMRLHECDRELYMAYASDDDFFETFALHGFRQLASRAAAIVALEQESARIIGTLTTLDVVDMMLDTMLEGWHFGVRESRMQVAGFVPSIKKEGAITMYDESDLQERRPFRTQALRQQHKIRSRLLDRTKPIQTEVSHRERMKKAVRLGSDTDHMLNETEHNIKFGLFTIALMFFQSSKLVKRERTTWGGSHSILDDAVKKKKDKEPKSKERQKLDQARRNREKRQLALKHAYERAEIGLNRRLTREARERAAKLRKLRDQARLRRRQEDAALTLQSAFRGYIDRKVSKAFAIERAAELAQMALEAAATITLQRYWRGYVAREVAGDRREEMLLFLEALKRQEAKTMEREYYKLHPMEKLKKQMKAKFKKDGETEADELRRSMGVPNFLNNSYVPSMDGPKLTDAEQDAADIATIGAKKQDEDFMQRRGIELETEEQFTAEAGAEPAVDSDVVEVTKV